MGTYRLPSASPEPEGRSPALIQDHADNINANANANAVDVAEAAAILESANGSEPVPEVKLRSILAVLILVYLILYYCPRIRAFALPAMGLSVYLLKNHNDILTGVGYFVSRRWSLDSDSDSVPIPAVLICSSGVHTIGEEMRGLILNRTLELRRAWIHFVIVSFILHPNRMGLQFITDSAYVTVFSLIALLFNTVSLGRLVDGPGGPRRRHASAPALDHDNARSWNHNPYSEHSWTPWQTFLYIFALFVYAFWLRGPVEWALAHTLGIALRDVLRLLSDFFAAVADILDGWALLLELRKDGVMWDRMPSLADFLA